SSTRASAMTEPLIPQPPAEDVAPPSQAIDGEVLAPIGTVESTAAAGLDLKVRSQWSYARDRFFRHRAALVGPFGLIVIFVAGYFGGLLDNILMRITDLVLTLPALAILLAMTSLLAGRLPFGSQWTISLILAAFFWTGIARVVRGVFLSLREKEYVEAAKAS